ncbi:RDD family protein [Roseiconus nitratireducens]|uniref:RDD family protein n=1 Tax=Roseiconus nitratireducens TaxID=2605748 RepID=A0A5M6CVE4_9BACT|nr:RDD family protein [Roseiconus nitratireducens]KAA5537962.1 RDD family protein [Roseiconus nitratireducens]
MADNSLGDADFYDLEAYAGIGKRLSVVLIDVPMLLVAGVLTWLPFVALIQYGVIRTDPSRYFWLLFLLIIWLYLVPMKRSVGTVGYWATRLKIVSAKGGQPSLLTMTCRLLLWIFGPFNLALDLLWLGADTERQTLRDCYLGTYVVDRSAKPIGRGLLHLTRYNACGLTLAYPRVVRSRFAA